MDKFVDKYLEDVEWNQNFSQGWNVSGVLKNRLNENLKYDLRPVKIKKIHLKKVIKDLDWNIILNK